MWDFTSELETQWSYLLELLFSDINFFLVLFCYHPNLSLESLHHLPVCAMTHWEMRLGPAAASAASPHQEPPVQRLAWRQEQSRVRGTPCCPVQVTPRFFKLRVPQEGEGWPQDTGLLPKTDKPQDNTGTLIAREDMQRALVVEARGL